MYRARLAATLSRIAAIDKPINISGATCSLAGISSDTLLGLVGHALGHYPRWLVLVSVSTDGFLASKNRAN